VNAESFPGALAQIATSLRLVRHDAVERDAVLAAFLNTFEPIYDHWLAVGPAAGVAEWRRHAALGQRCWWSRGGQRIEGVATGVSESGALRVRIDGDHTVAVHAGEVNWVGTG
jgi:BirA family biotin operon repressor/biotin-[acetyl-CoA-carboxylase] ligase